MAFVAGYNERKGAQVVAFFAMKSARAEIDVLKVVKLVYLADRESIKRYGAPILDDDHFSLPHGPVNSCTYDYLKGEIVSRQWSEIVKDRANHKVGAIVRDVDALDELSEADLDVLESVWSEFGHMDKWALVDYTHDPENIPEWEDPDGGSQRIPLRRTLDALGVKNSAAQEEQILSQRRLQGVLKKLSA